MPEYIELAHGHGGRLSLELIEEVILPALGATEAPILDAALLPRAEGPLVISTDSFTISPIFFPGGDIGKLAACGTMNDIAMLGARPLALSLGLIIEEGFPVADLRRVLISLGEAAAAAGVRVVTGDTKVVEKGQCDGIFLNTTGVGVQVAPAPVRPDQIRRGDVILVSGCIAEHGVAILNARHRLNPDLRLESDCAALWPLVERLIATIGADLHALRDPTRGGLAATLNEIARDTRREIVVEEARLPLRPEVAQVLDILGMDPLIMANEGKFVAFVAPAAAERALVAMQSHPLGVNATVVGTVDGEHQMGRVVLNTAYGTCRVVEMPVAEGLPRIC